jgi:predicted GNAT family acetyltransferase
MSDPAARALAATLIARGEIPPGVNGALPAGRIIADLLAEADGSAVVVRERTRLHVVRNSSTRGVPGRLHRAEHRHLAVLKPWIEVFEMEAAAQAGRKAERADVGDEDVIRAIDAGWFWVWEVDGEPVQFTGHNPPVYGVVRIGPVFTPAEHRRRGYASAAVGAVSRLLLDEGHRVCLYTDVDNPTSNKVYADLGFVPVVDQANHRIVDGR